MFTRRTRLLLFWLALQANRTKAAPLEDVGECSADFQCGECEGDCDTNGHCEDGLWCFERVGFTEVPGCEGRGERDTDYCVPFSIGPRLRTVGCSEGDPCDECQGECASDGECLGSLKCFFRSGQIAVPGCAGRGVSDRAYCYDDGGAAPPDPTPAPADPPTPEPTKRPTEPPTPEPTKRPTEPPTPEPTKRPTEPPTPEPTKRPTEPPTPEPSPSPTRTFRPSSSPTASPTDFPSVSPTTSVPSTSPSTGPTTSLMPSSYPTTSSPTFGFANTDIPERIWFKQLESATQKGNAVTFSPDGVLVYITTADGSLRVLYASSGEERWSYSPGIGSKGWPITCKSGVSFGMDDAGEFAVYAIIDEAPDGDDSESESRIIAVSHPSNQMLWISVPLAGEVAGTPFVTQSPDTVGSYIYTTHNTVKGPTPEGLFSVMAAGDGAILLTESASSTGVANIYTYGPPGGSHFPSRGMYTGGENNTNDIVVWVTSDDNGLGREAFLRAFQLPMGFDPAMLDEMLVTSQLANVAWSAVTSPTMSEDGTSLFVTARRSRVHAWVNDTLFDGQESWTADLVRDSGRPSLPILNEGIMSVDERRFFASSRAATFASIDVTTGQVLWEVPSMSVFQSAPKISRDDERVYAIQSADGRIYAWNQTSGDVLWSVSCDNYEEDCANSVDSDFDLSPDSLVLIYVDAVGRTTALQVGTSRFPTAPPTDYPREEPPVAPTRPPTTLAPASSSSPVTVTPFLSPTGTSDNGDDEPTASPVDDGSPEESLGTSSGDWRRPLNIVSLAACLGFIL